MQPAVAWMERHQVVLYLGALVAGAALGLGVPDVATPAENAVTPVLAALMFVTFLGVPFARIGRALRDGRFLWTILAVNFVVVPAVVWPLSRLVAHDDALVFGVLLVLLTPCVDYVIVFTGLAHGATERLLAASPVLMLAQLVLLPGYLWLLGGRGIAAEVEPGPFLTALVFLIVLPLCAAGLVQALGARLRAVAAAQAVLLGAMVPLMMATLLLVVASQIRAVGRGAGSLLLVVPIFVAFALVMLVIGIAAGRLARIDVPSRRALVFSGVTRNSLVVLPIALALPATLSLTPLVVVSQTLVELVMMVVLVRVVPRLIPQPDPPRVSHP